MIEQIKQKEQNLAVIGLGYVGLPIALAFARKVHVIGFDINLERIELMKQGIDPSNELEADAFRDTDIWFTADPEDLKAASFFIVAVPTPIDAYNVPNLRALEAASQTVGYAIGHGDYVVFESTVYPGCTEEDCIPIIEEISGLTAGVDFKYGYSPERINPGDKEHTIEKIIKVVSGNDAEALDVIAQVYELIVEAGVYKAESVKIAEAAKVIENTQRDLNIAFMNELSIIFDKMDIPTDQVLKAAGTKWNFLRFYPGLVGGHCIGVDPYYLTHKSMKLGYHPEVILSGRKINDGMPAYIAKKLVKALIQEEKNIKKSKVLVMGVTFKENVSDIRNSKVADLVKELNDYSLQVDIIDPHAQAADLKKAYGLELKAAHDSDYDAIIVAVAHQEYKGLSVEFFRSISKGTPIIYDLKGATSLNGTTDGLHVWRL
ncbi:MAG: nucleotide sugar dehydrogenase [Bacteroidota bacterium]